MKRLPGVPDGVLAVGRAVSGRGAGTRGSPLAGRPIRSVAREHGLSDFAVRYIVARDAPLLRGGGAM